MENIKLMIKEAIEYINGVSITEPTKIRVEETSLDSITLSFEYCDNNYSWSSRIYKQFIFKENEVVCMINYQTRINIYKLNK